MAKEDIIDLLLDSDSKDNVTELVNTFIEKVDGKFNEFDILITSKRKQDHDKTISNITESQHQRNRNIIMEIIMLKKKYDEAIKQKFE